jgi:hypothetical protein
LSCGLLLLGLLFFGFGSPLGHYRLLLLGLHIVETDANGVANSLGARLEHLHFGSMQLAFALGQLILAVGQVQLPLYEFNTPLEHLGALLGPA